MAKVWATIKRAGGKADLRTEKIQVLVFLSNKDGMETWCASLNTDMKRCHSSDFHEIHKQAGRCLWRVLFVFM